MTAKKRGTSKAAQAEEETMTIKELAEKANITPRAIRYYEEIGILTGIKRDRYNRRRYTKRDLYQLRLLKRARNLLGLSLEEIKELSKHFRYQDPGEKLIIRDSIKVLKKHLQMVDEQKKELKIARDILVEETKRLEALLKKRGKDT